MARVRGPSGDSALRGLFYCSRWRCGVKIALVGQSYLARSVAAAYQDCINLYPEGIEDPNEREKNDAILVGCPGRHLFKLLTVIDAAMTPYRGGWSGGGRLFVAGGTKYCELSPAGALVGSVRTIADDATHSPVIFIANGTQLAILSAGTLYVDNGAGPTAITLPGLAGNATAVGLFAYWIDGDLFDPGMVGQNLTVNGTTKVVDQWVSATQVRVTVTWGASPVTGVYSTSGLAMSCTSMAFLNGYLLASRTNSNQFNRSPLWDWTNAGTYKWDPLANAKKESAPDNISSLLAPGDGMLYVFGTGSFEPWQFVGESADNFFGFQRLNGGVGAFGSVSVNGPICMGGRVYFLGGDSTGRVQAYVLNGFTPERVSTYSQETAWNTQALGPTAISLTYLEDGHRFWGISFGSGSLSWFYDPAGPNGMKWHQRARLSGGNFIANGVAFHTYVSNDSSSGNDWGAGGKHMVGGDGTANVYQQSINFYDDNGSDWKWQRSLPYAYNEGKQIDFGETELELETGAVASGAAPVITMDYSDNRGFSFVDPTDQSIGVHNDTSLVVKWPPSGISPRRIYRFAGTGQSKVVLVAASQGRTPLDT